MLNHAVVPAWPCFETTTASAYFSCSKAARTWFGWKNTHFFGGKISWLMWKISGFFWVEKHIILGMNMCIAGKFSWLMGKIPILCEKIQVFAIQFLLDVEKMGGQDVFWGLGTFWKEKHHWLSPLSIRIDHLLISHHLLSTWTFTIIKINHNHSLLTLTIIDIY